MSETYPRDMVGYGRTPPFADWPGGARIALQFVINYEEGGENNILHGDAASEAFLSEIVGAAPWPGQRHMNMESIYEYGSRAGFWRLHRLFTERDVPVTVFAVATAMARNPQAVAAMNEAGWEIATHGYKWIDYRDAPAEVGSARTSPRRSGSTRGRRRAAARLLSGPLVDQHDPARLRGGRLPLLRRRLRRRSALLDRGAEGAAADRALHARFQRHALRRGARLQFRRSVLRLSQGFLRHALRRGRDGAEDAVDRPALPAGRPARRAPPRWRAFSIMSPATTKCGSRRGSTSRATGSRKHPPAGGWKPSRLTRTLFVERFGGVYEHSRWVAEAAYDAGLERERGQRRRARAGDGARDGGGKRGRQARADRRPSRSRGQARARQDAHRGIDAASSKAPASTG